MKKSLPLVNVFILALTLMLILNLRIYSQTQVFFDNFSSGTSKWVLTGSWGLSNSSYHSSAYSLTESPSGNYTNMQSSSATLLSFDLSAYLGSQLSFWAKYNLENSFDYIYLEMSKDGGTSFIKIAEFTGVSSTWQKHTFNIGGFAGNSNVKIRFRFYSDQYVVADGMYIDDVEVLGVTTDNSPPLIIHQAPSYYEGNQDEYNCTAEITDASGVNSASLYYYVDGTGPNSVTGNNIGGNQFSFSIPPQSAGSTVTYKLSATDNAISPNQTDTASAQSYKYISGTYISYDDANVDEVASITGNVEAAVKISIPSGMYGKLTTVLIRNYMDSNLSNSDMLFHVWDNNNGVPGNDLITPFSVTPEATLTNPFPFTVIDLRSYSDQLHDLTDDIFVGFTVPANTVNLVVSNNPHNRSFTFNGSTWSSYSKDYEFRAILNITSFPMPVELTSFTVSCVNNNVELIWRTATEVNNYGFEIYRSAQNTGFGSNDNEIGWNKIGFVSGHGNSNSPKYYSFTDKSLTTSGKYLYNLKQLDNDGKFEYSQITKVDYKGPIKNELNQNYPNPYNPTTIIKWQTAKDNWQTLKVYDILGNEISTLVNEFRPAGVYNYEFNASELPSGIYFYQLTAGKFAQTRKMIVVK